MDEFLAGYPFWAVWLFLYAGATLRGQATYWLGRAAISGAMRADAGPAWWRRTRARLARVEAGAGRGVIQRVGLVAIPVAYLTVGLQSAIIFAAGLIGIRWARFSLAQIPGAMAWATIYSTIGFAAWTAVIRALAGDWRVVLGVLVLIVLALLAWGRVRARSRDALIGERDGGD